MWRDQGRILKAVGFTLTSFSTIVVVLRLYCRHFRMRMAGISDYLMLVTLLSTWANTVLNYYQTKFGKEGKLYKNDPVRSLAAFEGILLTWFIYRPAYILTLSLLKLSILTFYRTLVPPFTSVSYLRPVRFAANALTLFMIFYSIAIIAASIFQCTPVSAGYSVAASLSQDHKEYAKPHCYQPLVLWIFSAVVNFTTDLIILLLPIPIVLSLKKMPRRKRMSLLSLFSVGALAVTASAVRMWILFLWGKDIKSQARYGTELLIWGQVEINCGILGGCAMFLRPLFTRCNAARNGRAKAVGGAGKKIEGRESPGDFPPRIPTVPLHTALVVGQRDLDERSVDEKERQPRDGLHWVRLV